ncbi:MAG: hypothetical protein MRY57_02630 [Candidatus Pacebacteria bacterium]|nr:hypothetical protein [Candidatus Paceibacterota bacterium]
MKKKKWYDSEINGIKVKMDGIGNFFDKQGNKIDRLLLFPNSEKSDFNQSSNIKKEGKVIPLGASLPWNPNTNSDTS